MCTYDGVLLFVLDEPSKKKKKKERKRKKSAGTNDDDFQCKQILKGFKKAIHFIKGMVSLTANICCSEDS